jgi:hypothetical protein
LHLIESYRLYNLNFKVKKLSGTNFKPHKWNFFYIDIIDFSVSKAQKVDSKYELDKNVGLLWTTNGQLCLSESGNVKKKLLKKNILVS